LLKENNMQKKSNDFEKNLERLEEISQKLSLEEISLEEASKLYEEGMFLSDKCKKYIEEKEMIIENLK
jgi:exonuclease VII small subunit